MGQNRSGRRAALLRAMAAMLSITLAVPLGAPPLRAQTDAAAESSSFNTEQLDALLAPIALYPDALLMQILMASTEPLQIVEAKRWLDDPAHSNLTGDALTKALEAQSWDPSVKSLIPFPTVLSMMNGKLDWTQQMGFAFATQQADVLDSVQRLRRQAQAAGHLQSSPQQTVTSQADAVVIQPVNPQTVYVPTYDPAVVYGTWPYPATPPVILPPPPGYAVGSALATGLAFGAGIAVTAALWNLATPNWGWRGGGYGGVNVNVNRWNNVNVNRPPLQNGNWRPPPAGRPGGWNPARPPGGPVGRPSRPNGVPSGAIGRPNVQVPGNLVNRPSRPQGSPPPLQRPGGNAPPGANRPGGGNGPGINRPGAGTPPGANRPGGGNGPGGNGTGVNRPAGGGVNRPNGSAPQRPGGGAAPSRPAPVNRPAAPPRGNGGGAFGGMNEGRQAGQFAARGGQSRASPPARPSGGGGFRGGGGGGGGHGGGLRHR